MRHHYLPVSWGFVIQSLMYILAFKSLKTQFSFTHLRYNVWNELFKGGGVDTEWEKRAPSFSLSE